MAEDMKAGLDVLRQAMKIEQEGQKFYRKAVQISFLKPRVPLLLCKMHLKPFVFMERSSWLEFNPNQYPLTFTRRSYAGRLLCWAPTVASCGTLGEGLSPWFLTER